jgi:pantothenate kinase type III
VRAPERVIGRRTEECIQAGVLYGTADGLAADGALRVRGVDGTTTAVRSGTVALARTSATADLRSCS